MRGSDFSAAWHQGYFDARSVLFDASGPGGSVRLRSETASRLRAARILDYPGTRRDRDLLDYIDGAWHFLEAVMGR